MQPNFDQVIGILKKEGLSDEQIAQFINGLNKALAEQLYLIITEQLNEEDMQKLNGIADEAERQQSMRAIFEQKTGQNLQQLSDGFVKSYIDEFLKGYKSLQQPATQ